MVHCIRILRGSQFIISKNTIFLSLKIDYVLANSADPDEMPHNVSFNLRLFFVCFGALRPKSTAMVIAGRSVHLTTLFPGQALTSG